MLIEAPNSADSRFCCLLGSNRLDPHRSLRLHPSWLLLTMKADDVKVSFHAGSDHRQHRD
ncbi:hypothetical protein SynA1560_01588 [Synechococcus sp. A15-60]|nr:hypothetical protein SynA1560_01588 [Synechococcus sp. A15-60]